jgi:hypothetical protein
MAVRQTPKPAAIKAVPDITPAPKTTPDPRDMKPTGPTTPKTAAKGGSAAKTPTPTKKTDPRSTVSRTAIKEPTRTDGGKLNPRATVTYFPSITKGKVTKSCPHTTYGHETIGSAEKCLRQLIAQMPKTTS